MYRNVFRVGSSCLIAAGCLLATAARAQEAPSSEPTEAEPAASEGGKPAEGASASKEAAVEDAREGDSPVELPGKTYRFVGARYRGIIVPKFMQNLFADGGRTLYVHAVGPEFAIRKDGFEYNLSAWLAFYNMDDTAFKGKNDPDTAWEIISTKMQILYLTSDFLWSHEFSPEVALNYGVGAGLGLVFGDLFRTQSYPTALGQDPNDYSKCNGPLDPNPIYCDADPNHNHYSGYTEPSWANGGSKPMFFPWLALQTGLRFKPAKSFAGRLDLGFGTSGFFFGVGGDYGL
jgi:hypothetical protein